MQQIIYQVDAFTSQPFAGNPAGVCSLSGPADEAWMQKVAREMNLSETAFLVPKGTNGKPTEGYDLRWFTPAAEVALCGHATLASAHILWETGALSPDRQARFLTRSGWLTAVKQGDWIEMDFPAKPEQNIEPPTGLAEALGVRPIYVGKNTFDYLVEVDDEASVRALRPDFTRLTALSSGEQPVRGVIVTSRSASPEFDFVSRFFAPSVGVDEDPVTGSAHCCLAPYWAARLGKHEMTGRQVSARGGVVGVRLVGDRVLLRGQAVTIMKCELAIE
jgi:PhzF family phenazine biosynthesis protein